MTSNCDPFSDNISQDSIQSMLDSAAAQQPDKTAFELLEFDSKDNECVSYLQLKRQVDFVAGVLYSKYNIGDRVVLFYPTSIESVVALLGCLASGIVAVPVSLPKDLEPVERDKWLTKVVDDADASAVLTTEVLAKIIQNRFPGVDIFDPGNQIPAVSHSDFKPNAASLAMITNVFDASGKVVTLRYTYSEVMAKLAVMKRVFGHDENSVFVSCLNPNSEAGIFKFVLQTVYVNCTCIFMSPCMTKRSPRRWLVALNEYLATAAFAPHYVFALCANLSLSQIQGLNFDCLKQFVSDEPKFDFEIGKSFYRRFQPMGLNVSVLDNLRSVGEVNAPSGNVELAAGVVSSSILTNG